MFNIEVNLVLFFVGALTLTIWVKDDVNALTRNVNHTLYEREVHYENFPDAVGERQRPTPQEIPRRFLLHVQCEKGINCQPMSQGPQS